MEPPATSDTTVVVRRRGQSSKLYLMICGVIAISLLLVSVAMAVYNSSGAAQLDLSGPGFKDVQKKVQEEKDTSSYQDSGSLDKAAFDDFRKMYDERMKAVTAINGFDPAAASSDSFNLTPVEQTTN